MQIPIKTKEKSHAQLQIALIQLLKMPLAHESTSQDRYEGILKKLREIFNILIDMSQFGERPQFRHDIQSMINGLKGNLHPPKIRTFKGWTIVDTDHPWDLFMAGTDVEGSCQALDRDPKLNKCLMAYVMDPKYRMLALQDETGTTMVRCILRILLGEHEQPVLFMEEIYPENARADFKEVLKKFALLRAQTLNLPLLSLESTPDSYQYPSAVHSLYSPAPCEYVDALYGVQEGEYTIPAAQCLFDPKQAHQLATVHDFADIQRNLNFAWESWKTQYRINYPEREAAGYGPGAVVLASAMRL